MKIAHLISTFLPVSGGAQICIHNIAQRQVQKGHNVVIVAPSEFKNIHTGDYKKERLLRGTLFFLRNAPGVGKLYLFSQLKKIQKKYKFDIWQVTIGYPLGIAAVDFFKKNNIPCILRCTGFDIQKKEDINYGVRLNKKIDSIIREKYKCFDAVVAVSKTMYAEYTELGVPEEKIYHIPNGVDCARFKVISNRKAVRKKLGIRYDQKLIITVGRNHPKKGFSYIPNIIKVLLTKRKDFIWLLIGKETSIIKELADNEKLGEYIISRDTIIDNLKFEYPSKELIEIYRSADLFVFPTLIETFGMVVIEAMAAGLPIVTTNAPGVDDIVENAKTGFKSPVGDVEKMAENIDILLNDFELYSRLQRNVLRESIKYDWGSVTDSYLDLYKKLVI